MLLTVSTTHAPATDLGYLLHKHPDRVQQFKQSFGTATVFYPEADDERCTVALMIEVDPVRLRGKGSVDFSLGQYVNDRSYAASSLLAVALADVFSTARAGRCDARPDLAEAAIPLDIAIPVLPCRGGPAIAERVFAPLGWRVEAEPIALDDEFPRWGDSRYVRLRLTGRVRLADALNQLHVLLPALDESKHYWQGSDEVDKLLRSGSGWLAGHPEAEFITRRYLGRATALANAALARLIDVGDDPPPDPPLNTRRHDAVLQALRELGAASVIDLGCGSGLFLQRLVQDRSFTRIAGCDVSIASLQQAARRLDGVELFQGALTYEDARFAGFDAAVLMEVIEHVDLPRLDALEHVVFGAAKPRAVIVTTPNRDYNPRYADLVGMRHPDHRFEWSRAEFAQWTDRVAAAHGYTVHRGGIGEADADLGSPTQVAVFTRD